MFVGNIKIYIILWPNKSLIHVYSGTSVVGLPVRIKRIASHLSTCLERGESPFATYFILINQLATCMEQSQM